MVRVARLANITQRRMRNLRIRGFTSSRDYKSLEEVAQQKSLAPAGSIAAASCRRNTACLSRYACRFTYITVSLVVFEQYETLSSSPFLIRELACCCLQKMMVIPNSLYFIVQRVV
jgi:hypothetical protein